MINNVDDAVESLVSLQGAIAAAFGPGAVGQSLSELLDAHKQPCSDFSFSDILTAPMSVYQKPYALANSDVQLFVYDAFNRPHGYLSYVCGLYKTWVRHSHESAGVWPDLRVYTARMLFKDASESALRFVDSLVLIAALFHRIENIATAKLYTPNDLTRYCLLSRYGIKITPVLATMIMPELDFSARSRHTFFDLLIKTFLKEEFPNERFV